MSDEVCEGDFGNGLRSPIDIDGYVIKEPEFLYPDAKIGYSRVPTL